MFYKLTFFSNNNIKITIKIISNSSIQGSKVALLKPADNLLLIRQELKNYDINDTLLFLRKHTDNEGYCFADVAPKDEEIICLNEIIDKNILYIKCKIKINVNLDFLNNKCKLDYGCTMTVEKIKRANKRAFQMKNCELAEIGAEGCQKGVVEFESDEDWVMKKNLFFSSDINVKNFVKLGMSIGTSKNENSNLKTNNSYQFTKYGKATLKFGELEPTQEFIEVVKDAIESKDPENFRQITKEFGKFIPTEVILGGRAYFNETIISTKRSVEKSENISVNADANGLRGETENTTNYSGGRSNSYRSNCTNLLGGEQPDSLENFDEETWIKSLKDYKNWDSIEFRNPINIFQLLPDDLRKQIIMSVGKRIHYSTIEDLNYPLDEPGKPIKFVLKNIPSDILKNKDADCSIFATVTDMTKPNNDFFTCQALCPPNGKPSLLIHCIQKKFNKRRCKLKIRWMVIGYYTDFNFIISDFNAQLIILKNEYTLNNQTMINKELLKFEYDSHIKVPPCLGIPVLSKLDSSNNSLVIGHHFFNAQGGNNIGACTFSYCSKNNHYVNLPDFTFCTLIILNYPINNVYDTIPFNYSFMNKPYINLDDDIGGSCLNPKFISLYSTQEDNYGPIFLKQNSKKIKTKSINCGCKMCFNNKPLKTSKDNIGCSIFDPNISDN